MAKRRVKPVETSPGPDLLVARFLLLVALGVSAFLAWSSLKGGGVPGCGPESDCDKVLGSRWAYWFGLPVSAFALPVYAVSLVLVFQKVLNWRWLVPVALVILGAALWFTGLQVFAVGAFCKFCMTAHAAGVVAALILLRKNPLSVRQIIPAIGTAVALLGVLVVGQVLSAPPAPLQLAGSMTNQPAGAGNVPATNSALAVSSTNQGAAPTFTFVNGQFTLDLTQVPVSGPLTAPKKMVKLFDYTCHHCRDLHHLLKPVKQKYPSEVAVILLPMPLDAECNSAIKRTASAHINACEYARLALAVFFANSEKFEEFSNWLFEPKHPPALEAARARAENLVGKEALDRAAADPRVDAQIRMDVEVFTATYKLSGRGAMPQLLFERGGSIGAVPNVAALDKILFDALGLGVPPVTNSPPAR